VESEWEVLKGAARLFKKSAFAASSQKTYKCQLKIFLQFCLDFKCMPLPCSQETLIVYTAFLAKKMLPSSVGNYLNVVRMLHVEAGFANPLADSYELSMLKRGINRLKGVPPNQKLPITVEILLKLYPFVNLSVPSDLSFWAVCILGFLWVSSKIDIIAC
jgi:hypothetical protein